MARVVIAAGRGCRTSPRSRSISPPTIRVRPRTYWIASSVRRRVLRHGPVIGRLRADLQRDVRSFAVGRYVIFYRASDLGIEVVRVLQGMRDIDRIFGPEK